MYDGRRESLWAVLGGDFWDAGPVLPQDVVVAHWNDLSPTQLHELVRLRVDVFVVEQQCPYPELDGRDLEPTTRQLLVPDGSAVVATLRLLRDPDALRIGRVCTASSRRGAGLSAALLAWALSLVDDEGAACVLDAQSYLRGWYERFDFEVVGPEFLEDGIAHLPMRREARETQQ